ncbi:MAG: hypothetical protein WCE54_11065 [Ignavibacteriaceae bacterium]
MKLIKNLTLTILFSIIFITCSKEPDSNVVDVTAKDYYFYVSDSIPSGWTTFRFHNEGNATHFFFLTLLPDSISFERYHNEVLPPFVTAMDTLEAGASKADAGALLGSLLPKWYASAKAMGGAGLTAHGKTSQTTINLEPGNYAMECYIKTEDGKFHSELGMIRPLTVTNSISKMKEPEDADIEINIYKDRIESQGNLSSGNHLVAVHFKEQPEFGLGNDVHLVRINENTNMQELKKWMDWMNLNGLRTPAPAEFLGGTQEMPAGYTSYFTINLEPGTYAWISEPSAERGMIKEFTIN